MSTKEEAKAFIESINSNDRVALVFHDDLDGFASGILLYDFLVKKGVKDIKTFIFTLNKTQLNLEYFNDIKKVIFADLGPNQIVPFISSLKDKEILYIDHHPVDVEIPKNIIAINEPQAASASKIIYGLIGSEKEFLFLATRLCDVGWIHENNIQDLQDYMKKEGLTIEQLKSQSYSIGYFLVYLNKEPQKAFDIMQKLKDWNEISRIKKYSEPIEKEVERISRDFEKNKEKLGEVTFFYFTSKYDVKSIVINKTSFPYPAEIFVFAVPQGDQLRLSARNQSGRANMTEILRVGMKDLENANAGGHPAASGGIIMAKDLEKFKENLRNYNF